MGLDLSFLPLELIGQVLQGLIFLGAAYFVLLSLSLVVWTWNDISARSRDIFARLLAPLMVLVFNLPGLLLYYILRPHDTLAEAHERELEAEALLQDMEERDVCPECGYPIQPDFMVCPHCQTEIRRVCSRCGRLLELDWNVCPYCGQPVESPPELPDGRDSEDNRTTRESPVAHPVINESLSS
ncbi:MAG: zinc ribbon domain-containing protein [Chloroflexota bacterium]|nr:zinc ribbon domain-containing protein [Chloroflexota bacterium]